MLSSLRPTPSPYRTPPDLPSILEELSDQVPECSEGPPLEEVQEEKKENPFGWNLPPTPSNWHDTPPKKGVPYAVLFGRDPIYVYDDNNDHGSLTVRVSLSPAAFTPPHLQTRLGLCQVSRTTVCGLLGRKGGTHPLESTATTEASPTDGWPGHRRRSPTTAHVFL